MHACQGCSQLPAQLPLHSACHVGTAQIEKARSWFQRAVLLDPDHGDAWAHYCAFERQHGTPDTARQVLDKCIAAEPHHGERWQRVSKALENVHKTIAQLLPLVVADLESPPP